MISAELATLLAVLARVSAWSYTAPLISGPSVPPRVRMGVALALAALVATARPAVDPDALWSLIPAEVVLGLVAGFGARLIILGAEAAGQLIGMSLGIGFASFYDPGLGEDALPTRRIAGALAGLAFLSADGLQLTLRALAYAPPASGDVLALSALVDGSAQVFVTSVRASAPVLVAALVSNLAMAFASRAAPSLNAFSVMLALFLVVGGAVLLATAPAFARELLWVGDRATTWAVDLLGR